jgi:hypothetical protein
MGRQGHDRNHSSRENCGMVKETKKNPEKKKT